MAHTYEEIRSSTLEVLAGKVPIEYSLDQYAHLKIGVGESLRIKDGLPKQPPRMYAADAALDKVDADLFLEVFWDLFRDGVITLGINDSNKEFPFFRLTSRGRNLVNGADRYFLHDIIGYEKQIKSEIPLIDEVTLIYLKEALQSFRAGCIISSTVMLGVAAEHTFILLIEKIEANATHNHKFKSVFSEVSLLRKINKFKAVIEQNKKDLPPKLLENFDTQFLGIQSLIRGFRNESGHPSGKILEREQAFVNLQLFVSFGRKAYQFIEFYSKK